MNRHRTLTHQFAAEDEVLLSTEHLNLPGAGPSRSLRARYAGPFTIERMINANAAKLQLPPSLGIHPVVNVSRLKPFHTSDSFPARDTRQPVNPPHSKVIHGTKAFNVECFLRFPKPGGKINGNKTWVRWRWQGYGPEHDSVEASSTLKQDLGEETFAKLVEQMSVTACYPPGWQQGRG